MKNLKIEAILNGENKDYTQFDTWVTRAYINAKEEKQEIISFKECIFVQQVFGIVESLKKFGIKEFGLTSGYSGSAELVAIFEENGCKLVGSLRYTVTNKWGETNTTYGFKMSL